MASSADIRPATFRAVLTSRPFIVVLIALAVVAVLAAGVVVAVGSWEPGRATGLVLMSLALAFFLSSASTLVYWPSPDRTDFGLLDVAKDRRRVVRRTVLGKLPDNALTDGERAPAVAYASAIAYFAPYQSVRVATSFVGTSCIAFGLLFGGLAGPTFAWMSYVVLATGVASLAVGLPHQSRMARRALSFERRNS